MEGVERRESGKDAKLEVRGTPLLSEVYTYAFLCILTYIPFVICMFLNMFIGNFTSRAPQEAPQDEEQIFTVKMTVQGT